MDPVAKPENRKSRARRRAVAKDAEDDDDDDDQDFAPVEDMEMDDFG